MIVALLFSLFVWGSLFGALRGEAQQTRDTSRAWLVYADTAGISAVPGKPGVYTTWVFAKESPTSFPSSGLIVEWDCANGKVRRVAQIKYELAADSTVITGQLQEVNGPWVEPVDPRLYALVCTLGPQHEAEEAWKREEPRRQFDAAKPQFSV
jgi:hypothetical protein